MKGRSSSWQINKLLRQSIADVCAWDCRGHYGYVRSKLNPADDPTRGAPLREPCRDEAIWVRDLKKGLYDQLDRVLDGWDLSLVKLADLPPSQELAPEAPWDYRKSCQLKEERGRRMGSQRKRCKPVSISKAEEEEPPRCVGFTEAENFATAEEGAAILQPFECPDDESPCPRDRWCPESDGSPNDCTIGVLTEDAEKRGEVVESASSVSSEKNDSSAEVSAGQEPQRHDATAVAFERKNGNVGRSLPGGDREARHRLEELLRHFHRDQFVFSSRFDSLEEAILSGPGLLDLFSGARGVAKQYVEVAKSWAVCFDLKHRADEDLLNPQLQLTLLKQIRSRFYVAMGAGPVCASFSTAITPPWRTKQWPAGRPDLTPEQQAKIKCGQLQLEFVLRLVKACLKCGVYFWVENPSESWFWKQQGPLSWQPIMDGGVVGDLIVGQCRFKTPWRKRTRFKKVSCECTKPHVVLRGRCPKRRMNFTKLAEAYPRALCSVVAAAIAIDVGALPGRRRLDVGACARSATLRIGEAVHPGPRRAQRVRTGRLEDVNLLEPHTVQMRQRFWTSFVQWLEAELGAGALQWCLAAPILLVKVLEAYGFHQFSSGTPLYYYRQLVAHVQREFPLTRQFMNIAWAVVSRWEVVEPTQHRAPLPEPVVRAFGGLALAWGWSKVAAIMFLSFYSLSRIGEVLHAQRKHLLTPEDLLSERAVLYLRIISPKSRGRGPKVQYCSCDEAEIVKFCAAVWQHLDPEEYLCPFSPGSFRRRWDALLHRLGVQKHHRLTPGGLRGGGAVWGHRQKLGIDELCWRMRLQHAKTLQFYLQELTAESILPSLDGESREAIRLLQSVLPFLMQEFIRNASLAHSFNVV